MVNRFYDEFVHVVAEGFAQRPHGIDLRRPVGQRVHAANAHDIRMTNQAADVLRAEIGQRAGELAESFLRACERSVGVGDALVDVGTPLGIGFRLALQRRLRGLLGLWVC